VNTSQLIAFLNSIGARPRKDLSQNFLINPDAIAKIVDLAEVAAGDWVLEIGPGTGAITQELLKRGAHVLAVEKDPLFAKHLQRIQTESNHLEIVCCDFLSFSIPSQQTWKVVSNLPFQITAPILTSLCGASQQLTSATLVVQKEVGDRICAKPHSKLMGSLTIFLQFYAQLISSFPLSSDCFYPKPAVESTVLQLRFKQSQPPIDPDLFFQIVHQAFQQRRKMVTTSLKTLYPKLGKTLEKVGIPTNVRPEDLSLQEWIKIIAELLEK
jgi:16S rRNA (adenine1518-N6/adenine1519-N6)-dimethyltransferase